MHKPLFPALAHASFAATDAALAETFDGHGFNVVGRLSKPDLLVFEFFRQDGSCIRYTAPEMRRLTWWYWLREDDALQIEANLFEDDLCQRNIHYVARADMNAGGLLIRGSRLTNYFSGEAGEAQAHAECARLRIEWQDAGVFSADSIEEAERILAADDPLKVSQQSSLTRMASARAKRLSAFLS